MSRALERAASFFLAPAERRDEPVALPPAVRAVVLGSPADTAPLAAALALIATCAPGGRRKLGSRERAAPGRRHPCDGAARRSSHHARPAHRGARPARLARPPARARGRSRRAPASLGTRRRSTRHRPRRRPATRARSARRRPRPRRHRRPPGHHARPRRPRAPGRTRHRRLSLPAATPRPPTSTRTRRPRRPTTRCRPRRAAPARLKVVTLPRSNWHGHVWFRAAAAGMLATVSRAHHRSPPRGASTSLADPRVAAPYPSPLAGRLHRRAGFGAARRRPRRAAGRRARAGRGGARCGAGGGSSARGGSRGSCGRPGDVRGQPAAVRAGGDRWSPESAAPVSRGVSGTRAHGGGARRARERRRHRDGSASRTASRSHRCGSASACARSSRCGRTPSGGAYRSTWSRRPSWRPGCSTASPREAGTTDRWRTGRASRCDLTSLSRSTAWSARHARPA